MKKIALILMVAVLSAGSVFAAKDSDGVGLYARGSIGWASWTFSENGLSESVNHFSIEPVFGLTNLFPVKGLGIEGFVDCNFGGKSFGVADISSKVFAPGARVMYARSIGSYMGDTGTLDKLVPYAGAGFCLPIMHWSNETRGFTYNSATGRTETTTVTYSDTKVYFAVDFVTGCAFRFTDKFAAHGEFAFRFGSIFDTSFRIGGAFKIK